MPDARLHTPTIFLSYSRRDFDIARLLGCKLEDAGVSVWVDKAEIVAGVNWRRKVDKALKNSGYMLYLHSFDSEASDEVWYEWGYFLAAKKPILPVILDNTELPYPFVSIQHITFSETQLHTTIQKILAALGIAMPVPPDDPNDPGSGAKRPIREHSQEEQEHNYAYTAASSGDRNGDTRLFHLYIIELQQAQQIDFSQSRDESKPVPIDKILLDLQPPPTDTSIIRLDDSVHQQIEEVIDRTEHDGVPIRPSDLTHLEFEINDRETTSIHTNAPAQDDNLYWIDKRETGFNNKDNNSLDTRNPFATMNVQNSLEHSRQYMGMDRHLKNYNQYNENNSTHLFSLHRDNYPVKTLSNNKINAISGNRIDNSLLRSDNIREIISSEPQLIATHQGDNWMSYSDTIYSDSYANTGSNSYDCPN